VARLIPRTLFGRLALLLFVAVIASHVLAFSGGFMSVFMQEGAPKVFVAHGRHDEQLPIATSGRANAAKLSAAGYAVEYVEFDGLHVIHPPVVEQAIAFFLQ